MRIGARSRIAVTATSSSSATERQGWPGAVISPSRTSSIPISEFVAIRAGLAYFNLEGGSGRGFDSRSSSSSRAAAATGAGASAALAVFNGLLLVAAHPLAGRRSRQGPISPASAREGFNTLLLLVAQRSVCDRTPWMIFSSGRAPADKGTPRATSPTASLAHGCWRAVAAIFGTGALIAGRGALCAQRSEFNCGYGYPQALRHVAAAAERQRYQHHSIEVGAVASSRSLPVFPFTPQQNALAFRDSLNSSPATAALFYGGEHRDRAARRCGHHHSAHRSCRSRRHQRCWRPPSR